jgi:hypothetical protein
MQLQVLEAQLGEELFQKKGRVLELTEAGRPCCAMPSRSSTSATVFGRPALCREWPGSFPQRLRNARFLLPGQDAAVHTQ